MEDFQYNKILKRLIRTKSRSYKIGKEKKKNHQENYILKVKTCRTAKSERQLILQEK